MAEAFDALDRLLDVATATGLAVEWRDVRTQTAEPAMALVHTLGIDPARYVIGTGPSIESAASHCLRRIGRLEVEVQ